METHLSRALKASARRYRPSTLEVMASRWRVFCEESLPFRTASGWLDEAGLASTLSCFSSFTTRKRHFLLFRWVVRTLAQAGVPFPDPTPALEQEYSGEERTHHTVEALETQTDRMAALAGQAVRGWKGARLVALVRLLGDTGLRNEDVRLLPLGALSLALFEGSLSLTSKGVPDRVFALSKETCAALHGYLSVRPPNPEGLLFVADASGRALDPATLWRQLKRLDVAAGASQDAISGTTALRAAYAQQLRSRGSSLEDIQVALGHRKLASTLELLGRIRPARSSRRRQRASP
jgi:site-specific recombinase XerD